MWLLMKTNNISQDWGPIETWNKLLRVSFYIDGVLELNNNNMKIYKIRGSIGYLNVNIT